LPSKGPINKSEYPFSYISHQIRIAFFQEKERDCYGYKYWFRPHNDVVGLYIDSGMDMEGPRLGMVEAQKAGEEAKKARIEGQLLQVSVWRQETKC